MTDIVDDIYEALTPLTKGEALSLSDKEIDDFGERMKDALRSWARPPKRDSSFNVRMSNIGKPSRRLWFDKNNDLAPDTQHPKTFISFCTVTFLKRWC